MTNALPRVGQERLLDVPLSDNHFIASPLRYPGGKTVLSGFVASMIDRLDRKTTTYVEPYAGGAGVALRLLADGKVSRIVINDLDENVYAFWNSAVNRSREFLELFDRTDPTIGEWHRQKEIIGDPDGELERGFAFFFLNRTNRSGVLNGGVIGGLKQDGRYRVDARYNKARLRDKLSFLGEHAGSIQVSRLDGTTVAQEHASRPDSFVYLDPPYVAKGGSLYLNAFDEAQHRDLADMLGRHREGLWMLTYDDTELIRSLYRDNAGGLFPLRYSAASRRKANELMIFSDALARSV